jgi:hypothetical protein
MPGGEEVGPEGIDLAVQELLFKQTGAPKIQCGAELSYDFAVVPAIAVQQSAAQIEF